MGYFQNIIKGRRYVSNLQILWKNVHADGNVAFVLLKNKTQGQTTAYLLLYTGFYMLHITVAS